MQPRLSDYTAELKNKAGRVTVARALQLMHQASGDPRVAMMTAEGRHDWLDRSALMSGFKMAVSGTGTGTFDGRIGGAPADAFLAAVRDTSVLMQLMSMGLRVVPPRTRVYVDSNGVVVGEVAEGLAAPVLRGSWADTVLSPRKWVGLLVVTEELFKSNEPTVLSTLTSDLAAAIGEGENKAALHPDETGSVTANALAIASAGDDVAGVDADLKGMLAQVPAAAKGSGAWAMPRSTCQHIALLRGSGGSPAFPGVTATGGTLVGLPIFLTEGLSDFSSPPTSVICLLAANQILYSLDQRVELDSSRNALIEMSDAPTGDARAGTAASVNQVSMFQTHAVCLRAGMMSSWHARSGAATYCRVGY